MVIYHYDDGYATKNGVNGVKELICALVVGVLGLAPAAVLLGLGTISIGLFATVAAAAAIIVAFLIRRVGIANKASMSVLIARDDELYYLMVNPNMRGSSLPRSVGAVLAGPRAAFAENKLEAEVTATQLASDDEVIRALFETWERGRFATSIDSIMYGKPVRVSRILDVDFAKEKKRIYKVCCLKDNRREATIRIPRSFPAFFEGAPL